MFRIAAFSTNAVSNSISYAVSYISIISICSHASHIISSSATKLRYTDRTASCARLLQAIMRQQHNLLLALVAVTCATCSIVGVAVRDWICSLLAGWRLTNSCLLLVTARTTRSHSTKVCFSTSSTAVTMAVALVSSGQPCLTSEYPPAKFLQGLSTFYTAYSRTLAACRQAAADEAAGKGGEGCTEGTAGGEEG